MIEIPDPQYVQTDDGAYIAYQVVGDGPVDMAWQTDFYGNIDLWWDSPYDGVWLEGLASFARLILHDRRGTGLSSRNVPAPNLETRVADLRAVLDAVGSEQAVLGAWFESLAPCLLLAATDPDRVSALVWSNPSPRSVWAPDYPWGWGPDAVAKERAGLAHWGTVEHGRAWAEQFAIDNAMQPSEAEVRAVTRMSRNTCTPDVALALSEIWWETDVRGVLSTVQVPTLLIADGEAHREVGEYVASLMPQARFHLMPREDWPSGRAASERFVQARVELIQRFIGVEPPRPALDTILSTVLFTDVVGSTEHQARLGDSAWKALVERHHALVRSALDAWRGVENDTAGDGFYATFDGPARAIRCALEIRDRVRELGIEIRAGIHTGECELIDGKAGGIAVSIGARVGALAGPSEVLVSQTVKDLVAGSGLAFEERGAHELRGVPGSWGIYVARSDQGT